MFDSIVLSQILKEMALPGAHVNKITMPARDLLFFQLYGAQGAKRLLLSANASAPRLQYTDAVRENPDVPPNFCMLLRKYLGGARIMEVRQPFGDRILLVFTDTKTGVQYVTNDDLCGFSPLLDAEGRPLTN